MNNKHIINSLINRFIIPILLFTFILVTISGYLFYNRIANNIIKREHNKLKAISDLKIGELKQWIKERRADTRVISQNPFFINAIEEYLLNKNKDSMKKSIKKCIKTPQKAYKYKAIFILEPDGKPLLSVGQDVNVLGNTAVKHTQKAVEEAEIIDTDLYYCSLHKNIHFDVIAPVTDNANKIIALVLFRVDPNDFLYPLIGTWPTPSRTSETLIIRKEEDSVLFLNNLRHKKNAALNLKIPLSRKQIPSVQAVLGYKGIWEGKDYRKEKVVAYISQVPGTSWFMISKIDRRELYKDLYDQSLYITLATVLFGLLVAAGIVSYNVYNQKMTYQNLWQSQEEFKTVLYSIGDGVIITDNHANIKNMNPVAEELTGWPEKEAIGKRLETIFKIINEETGKEILNPVEQVIQKERTVGLANHTILISRKGNKIPISDSGAAIRDKHGDIIGVVLIFRDKTEEREAQIALHRSKERYRKIINNLPGGLIHIFDLDYNYTFNAGKELEHLELSNTELKGKNIYDVLPTKYAGAVENHFKKVLKGETVTFEGDFQQNHYLVTAAPLKDVNGKINNILVLSLNISKRKKTEKKLKELNRELKKSNQDLQEFAYVASHDLQEPLRMVSSFTKLLERKYENKLDKDALEYIQYAVDGAERMKNLIDALLKYSRVQTRGKAFKKVNVESVIRKVENNLKLNIEETNAQIIYGDDLPSVRADASQLESLFQNLIQNPIK